MNRTKKISAVAILSAASVIAACGDKSEDTTSTTTSTTSVSSTASGTGGMGTGGMGMGGGGGGMMNPPPPKLGAQIDRMGRPAINTVGSKTFDAAKRDAAEDAYNADGDAKGWVGKYKADIAASLAVLDALDAAAPTGCGNQVGAKMGPAAADTYSLLAGVLADDRLRVKLDAKDGCGFYLAVEAGVLGVEQDFCGGRTPTDDVVRVSYSALAGGAVVDFTKAPDVKMVFKFDDGVEVDAKLTTAFAAGFPYFAAKQ